MSAIKLKHTFVLITIYTIISSISALLSFLSGMVFLKEFLKTGISAFCRYLYRCFAVVLQSASISMYQYVVGTTTWSWIIYTTINFTSELRNVSVELRWRKWAPYLRLAGHGRHMLPWQPASSRRWVVEVRVFTYARVSMITYRVVTVGVYQSRPIGASLLCLALKGLHTRADWAWWWRVMTHGHGLHRSTYVEQH